MAFGFSQVTHVLNKAKRFLKIAEEEGSFDTVGVITQIPNSEFAIENAPLPHA